MEKEIPIVSFDGMVIAGAIFSNSMNDQDIKHIVICVHGSLLQNRDGDLDYTKKWMFPNVGPKRHLFKDIRRAFTDLGASVYCYDKRAAGLSEGDYAATDIMVLAKDLVCVGAELRKIYPKARQTYLGQSEGTVTIPIAIMKFKLNADAVILQGPAFKDSNEILSAQKNLVAKDFLNDKDDKLYKIFPFFSAFYNNYFNGELKDKIENSKVVKYCLKYKEYSIDINLDIYRQWGLAKHKQFVMETKIPIYYVIGKLDKSTPCSHFKEFQESIDNDLYPHLYFKIFDNLEHSFREINGDENLNQIFMKKISRQYIDYITEIYPDLLY